MKFNDRTDEAIDEFVAESRKLNNQLLHEREPWNSLVTSDAVRHHAYGISDDNPLWLDWEYAGRSACGKRMAPPTFVASVLYPGLHGAPMEVPLSSLIGELECRWFRPILEGDEIKATAKQLGVFESRNRQGRRLVNILAEIGYRNQRDELVARAESLMVRVAQRDTELLTDHAIYQYSDDELHLIKKALESETRTGSNLLDDMQTEVGYRLEPLVRGPLTVGDLVCWQAAIGPSYRPGALGYRDGLAQPHTVTVNPLTGWPVKYSQQHEDGLLSRQRGMPAPFDNTVMRWAWVSPLITNWMGDQGFLKRLGISAIEPVLYGDTNWYRGIVSRRDESASGVTLLISITGTNQRGVVTTRGEAEVELPRQAIRPATARPRGREGEEKQAGAGGFSPAHALFEQRADAAPDAVALECNGRRLTYGELNRRSNRLAHHLAARGARQGDRVAVCMPRCLDMVVAQLAVMKSGAVYVPLDPGFPRKRLQRMIDDTAASLLVTQRDTAGESGDSGIDILLVDGDSSPGDARAEHNPGIAVSRDDHAYIMYTSGSVGEPKAVAIAHSSLRMYVDVIRGEIPVGSGDRYLYTASPCFSASIRQTMLPLCAGATLVIADQDQCRDPRLLFELMRETGVSVWDTVPSVWQQYMQVLKAMPAKNRNELLDNRLRLVLLTGEALRWHMPYTWRNELGHGAEIINLYSQTETSGTVCLYRILGDIKERDGVVPLGRAVQGADVQLLDEYLQPVADGETGELCVSGCRIASGYLNDAALTAGKFVSITGGSGAGKLYYRTGDLARYGQDRVLLYGGRKDHQVKLRGYRVQLGEIETALARHPAIRQAVVVKRTDSDGQGSLVAYAVSGRGTFPAHERLREYLGDLLPAYMVPSVFVELDAFPLTASGKVDRSLLPTPQVSRPELDCGFVAPSGPIEEALVDIWEQALGVSGIGVDDDFVALGGDSLSATRIVSRLNETYGLGLAVRHLLETPKINGLAIVVLELLAGAIGEDGDADSTHR